MLGHFEVQVKDLPPGVSDRHLLELLTRKGKATPELDRLLARMHTRQRAKGQNQVFDKFAGFTLQHSFVGAGCGYPFDAGGSGLNDICLLVTDSEPTYTEAWGAYNAFHNRTDSANTLSGAKRFVEDDIDPHLMDSDPDLSGRESVLFRSRFLYLSTEGNSNNIRSLGVFYADNNGTGSLDRGRIARIRLKDSGGSPIIINKTSSQVLLIEYRFTLVTI